MPSPIVHPFPVKRPGFITEAAWLGPDDDLSLQVKYIDVGNITRTLQFATRNASRAGEICLPNSLLGSDLNNLGPRARDILVAHTRMLCMIAGLAIPGSAEFEAAFTEQLGSANLQTALGTVKVTAVQVLDDQNVKLTFRQGTGPLYDVTCDHGELNRYVFVPDTQLLVIPGSVEKQFPSYTHNHPSTVLSSSQKQDIVDYVLGLALWI